MLCFAMANIPAAGISSDAHHTKIISGSAGPIFAAFSPNESVLGVDDRSGPLFISQGTLPWQPIFGKICEMTFIQHIGILKWDALSSCGCVH